VNAGKLPAADKKQTRGDPGGKNAGAAKDATKTEVCVRERESARERERAREKEREGGTESERARERINAAAGPPLRRAGVGQEEREADVEEEFADEEDEVLDEEARPAPTCLVT
jgi:hypothetical protein